MGRSILTHIYKKQRFHQPAPGFPVNHTWLEPFSQFITSGNLSSHSPVPEVLDFKALVLEASTSAGLSHSAHAFILLAFLSRMDSLRCSRVDSLARCACSISSAWASVSIRCW